MFSMLGPMRELLTDPLDMHTLECLIIHTQTGSVTLELLSFIGGRGREWIRGWCVMAATALGYRT